MRYRAGRLLGRVRTIVGSSSSIDHGQNDRVAVKQAANDGSPCQAQAVAELEGDASED